MERLCPYEGPVKSRVGLVAFPGKEITEEVSDVGIVWLSVERKRAGVVQKGAKFSREAVAENICATLDLLFHDAVVLLLCRFGLDSLPR